MQIMVSCSVNEESYPPRQAPAAINGDFGYRRFMWEIISIKSPTFEG